MTDARLTQTSVEQWADGGASARLTQIASEQWATPTGIGVQALLTLIAVEQWAPVAATTQTKAAFVVVMA